MEQAMANVPDTPASESPLKVLVAEPSGGFRDGMARLLKQQGYQVICAEDGFDVLCRLPEWRPDLLLLADALPRLSGYQICSLLRDSPDFCSLRIILLTDDDNLLASVRAEHARPDAWLVKPFRFAELQRVLDDMPVEEFQRAG